MRDEARLLGLLHDDHVLKVLDLLQIEGRDAIVMEFVCGVDMNQVLEAGHRPPPRALAEIGATVSGALERAHRAVHPADGSLLGVVHRDVKPANIMVTTTGGLKLLDFGIARAKFAARESTTGQLVLGTLNYMAPDYIVTGEVTPALDTYGLGLTLWELITGDPLGQPKIREDVHNQRLKERIEQIEATHAFIAPLLREMLDWDPQARPSCQEVERRLNIIADEVPGPGLRTWSSKVVPTVLAKRKIAPDQERLLGRTIQIRGPAQVPTPNENVAQAQQIVRPSTNPNKATDIMDPVEFLGHTAPPLRASTAAASGPAISGNAAAQRDEPSVTQQKHTTSPPQLSGGDTNTKVSPSLSQAILRGIFIGSSFGMVIVAIFTILLFF
jgi:serine/threonine protein kinase